MSRFRDIAAAHGAADQLDAERLLQRGDAPADTQKTVQRNDPNPGTLDGLPVGGGAAVRANLRRLGMAADLDAGEWTEFAALVLTRLGVALGMLVRPTTNTSELAGG